MSAALLVLHLLIALALVAIVLLQRSEGGALGMGGGGGMMSGRGSANLLTRMTAWLAAAFFAVGFFLTLLAAPSTRPRSIFEPPQAPAAQPGAQPPAQPSPPGGQGGGGTVKIEGGMPVLPTAPK